MGDGEMLELVVQERVEERGGIVRLKLARADGASVPDYTAGSHLKLHVLTPAGELVRQYSLCSDPGQHQCYEIGVLREPQGKVSPVIYSTGKVGAIFHAGEPANNFPLVEDAPSSVLVAGGIGVTPMIAMAKRLHALGKQFAFHYCTRARDVTAFYNDLTAAPYAADVTFHFDNGPKDQRFDPAGLLPDPKSGAHLYVCGPQGFMEWVLTSAADIGYPKAQLHYEYFSADVDTSGHSFEVEARASGVTVVVGPGETITNALAAAGVYITVNCEEGICGTCLTDVLEGEIDHRDRFLTDEEHEAGDIMCACCSRAKGGKLVLDV